MTCQHTLLHVQKWTIGGIYDNGADLYLQQILFQLNIMQDVSFTIVLVLNPLHHLLCPPPCPLYCTAFLMPAPLTSRACLYFLQWVPQLSGKSRRVKPNITYITCESTILALLDLKYRYLPLRFTKWVKVLELHIFLSLSTSAINSRS